MEALNQQQRETLERIVKNGAGAWRGRFRTEEAARAKLDAVSSLLGMAPEDTGRYFRDVNYCHRISFTSAAVSRAAEVAMSGKTLTEGTIVKVTDADSPWTGYAAIVKSVSENGLVTTGRLVSPHGNLFGAEEMTFWNGHLSPLAGDLTEAQCLTLSRMARESEDYSRGQTLAQNGEPLPPFAPSYLYRGYLAALVTIARHEPARIGGFNADQLALLAQTGANVPMDICDAARTELKAREHAREQTAKRHGAGGRNPMDKIATIFVNVTTEDGELLERFEVEVTDDPYRPVGNRSAFASVAAQVADAARIVQARMRAEHGSRETQD